eukprot:TRINITY_DN69146_c0_g1_i1.p1 TRINITY_DN69146_c0_g1~~TRINITY_DN69146_c0_g1_i1.p1  ORF type:complete len:240 (+),score=67.23 TRINITY_DN69146_c0_g1_i1:18-737(+)
MLRRTRGLFGRGEPSANVQRIAAELLALPPKELEELRKECRQRLIPKPSMSQGPLPKGYNPSLKVQRSDRPMPVRNRLGTLGSRFGALHPAYVFAGSGPGIMPSPVPQVSFAIMAPHAAAMAPSPEDLAAAAASQAAPAAAPAVGETPAKPEEEVAEKAETAKQAAPLKASVTIKLISFEAPKKIAVVKEVRAMLGEGLKESKEKVESAPVNLKKNVPREEAEAMAEKLRAAGAEVSLE